MLEGVNDLGTRVAARAEGRELGDRGRHHRGLRTDRRGARTATACACTAATILPLEGFANYAAPDVEADRQRINDWIRTSGAFDGVIDFDRATRDPAQPGACSAAVDGGDHLHPSAAGYEVMANAVDLALFDLRSPGAAKKISPPR